VADFGEGEGGGHDTTGVARGQGRGAKIFSEVTVGDGGATGRRAVNGAKLGEAPRHIVGCGMQQGEGRGGRIHGARPGQGR